MEEYKLKYIKNLHQKLKSNKKEFSSKIPYEKMNDQNKLFLLRGKIESLTDILLLIDYAWEPEQIDSLTTRFKYE